MEYLEFLLAYAGPFVGLGLLILAWAYVASKLETRFPSFYKFTLKLYDKLPAIGAAIVIVVFIYYFFTQPSSYDR